jgi:hypothetical protein
MSNTQDDDEAYPANTPLEDEPERFITGSNESNAAETESGTDDERAESDETNADDDDAEVNDG